ncbi:hypothetical protein AP060_00704 [Pseudomonas sp. TAD18]|nr:hypothetical protein AP060_00704 [Pseudomonas sp. TAD18]
MRFEDNTLSVDYAYDPLGRRIQKYSNAHHNHRPEAGSHWNQNERARKQRELGCGFTLFGWDGDTLAWESSPAQGDGAAGKTVHYPKKGRYHGPKPLYENPGHHDPSSGNFRGGGSKTSVLPKDAESLYKKAIPDAEGKHWYAMDENGVTHRFGNSNDGNVH